jgi:hypothetical protein
MISRLSFFNHVTFVLQLKELIDEYGDSAGEAGASGLDSRHVKIENKNFFFSCKKNLQVNYTVEIGMLYPF